MVENGKASRRVFLGSAAKWSAALGALALAESFPSIRKIAGLEEPLAEDLAPLDQLIRQAPVARYWASPRGDTSCAICHDAPLTKGAKAHKHKANLVECLLCANRCVIAEGERGRCQARLNVRGQLLSLVYGRPITEHVDPIEKKPFYHFLPGSEAYSIATSGCPLRCRFCQNWQISQARPEDYSVQFTPPGALVKRASEKKAPVIAFTYNEPTVFTEYLCDTAREALKAGLRCVLVSCGFMNEAPLSEMIEVLDAIKIDLKGFSPDFYRDVSSARLEPVLRSIKQVAKSGRHLEIVNLVVPTLNDSEKMVRELAKWVASEAGPDVPLHFTRFHPDFQLLNLAPTPVETLERARDMAMREGLKYVYVGNVPGNPGNNTYCPSCKAACIERSGFFVTKVRMKDGKCAACGYPIAGVWK